MPWRIDPARIVTDAARELAALFPDDLRSLALYGSAAGDDFRPERSDINFCVVLDAVSATHLGRIAQWWYGWRERRVSVPLVLSRADVERSLDVFPLEFLDLKARHRILAGDDLFAALDIPHEGVRLQCEREAKGKLLRLRALYVELAGSVHDRRLLMLESRKTFIAVLRGLLHLRGAPWQGNGAAVVHTFERAYGIALPVIAGLGGAAPSDAIETQFDAYLVEVERLADVADREARPVST